ncbi:MAG: helix-turn-helix domain-containing protein [Acutalibacteraceae bacterium]
MDPYVTGTAIRQFREKQNMTQAQLAQKLCVSDKAVSKWETGNGYPDITLLEPLAQALGISVIELLSGNCISNVNRAFNMLRVRFYVCPVCGNVICATGETVVSCCGITLPALEAEPSEDLQIDTVEDEYFITIPHDMTKSHYISFMAAVSDDGVQVVKLYPEGNAEARFKINRTKYLYYFCNRHGLYVQRISRKR